MRADDSQYQEQNVQQTARHRIQHRTVARTTARRAVLDECPASRMIVIILF
jgi:hypothetical protein